MNEREWYRITAKPGSDVAELSVFNEIGGEDLLFGADVVTGKKFAAKLDALPESVKTIRVRVNSPGGSWSDAVHIANALRRQSTEKKRTVEVTIEGFAASAATMITSSGTSIRIPRNAVMMTHMPSVQVAGPASAMRNAADALDRITDGIISIYQWVSQKSAAELRALMEKTTWMSADEAVANGFATEIIEPITATATFRPEVLGELGEIPEAYRPAIAALVVQPVPDEPAELRAESAALEVIAAEILIVPADPVEVIRACKIAGVPELAEDLVVAKAPIEQVHARIAAAKEVLGLCMTARLPELAADYIKAGVPAAMVRNQLTALTAKFDSIEIDAHLNPNAVRTVQGTNVFDLYREREAQRLASLKGA